VRCIRSSFALLDGPFASNGNLGTGVTFHLLQSVATWSDK
jgi:hypothetical protein